VCRQTLGLGLGQIRYSSSIIISLQQERDGMWLEVTWHDVISLEKSRAVWKDLGSRRIGKSLEMEWHQGTMVPYGVHIVHTCMTEIKSMMSEHMYTAW